MPYSVSGFNLRFNLMIIFVTILLTVSIFSNQQVFAMGQAPSTCPNRYDGPITYAKIVAGGVTYDPIANPGVTFKLSNDEAYTLTFNIHTPTQSTQGNSDPGTTWFSNSVHGFFNGQCVSDVGPDQDVTLSGSVGHSNSVAPEGTQRIEFKTLVSDFYYHVMWVKPSSNNTTVPFPPTNLSANAISSSQIDLNWVAPTDNGGAPIIEYIVYRYHECTSTSLCYKTVHTDSIATSYSDMGLEPNTTYHYRVYAVNEVGTSHPSNTVAATTTSSLSLSVNTVDVLDNPLEGIWMQLASANGTIISAGFTPITFDVIQGEQYTVLANNYNQHVFVHWEDESMDSSRDITPTTNITITATYTITTVDKIVPSIGIP